MSILRPYEKIIAWQAAHKLCLMVYRVTAKFPSDERFCLGKQLRKAAYSVPLNIAEGNAKRTNPEKARFFTISLGSLEEVHCAIRLSSDLGYISIEKMTELDQQINRASYLLTRLRSSMLEIN